MYQSARRDGRARTTVEIARFTVGFIWLAGAAFNAIWTVRHIDSYQDFADHSSLSTYRWFFRDVVGAHPVSWTLVLVAGEATLGVLTLEKGRRATAGLMGGALWSALLFPLLWPFTLVMGPFAIAVAWLVRWDYPSSIVDILRHRHQAAVHGRLGDMAR